MINTTGHFLRFNMGEEEDTSLPKIVSADNTYPKNCIEEVFQNIKKGAQVSTNPKDETAMDLVVQLQGQNVTAVGDYDVFVPEVGVVTINITENPPINPTEVNLKITNIIKTEENPILYDPFLECYYTLDTTDGFLRYKVLYYKQYLRENNYRTVSSGGSTSAMVQLVPQVNYLGEIAALQFNYKNNLHEELLNTIPIVGRFIATVDDVNIILPPGILLSGGNPSIYNEHEYEYNIFNGKFNLMDVTYG